MNTGLIARHASTRSGFIEADSHSKSVLGNARSQPRLTEALAEQSNGRLDWT